MFANLWSQLVVLPLSGQKNKTKKQLLQVWKRRRGKGHWLSLKMRCDIDWDTLIFSLWYQDWFRAQSIFLLNIYQCSLLYSECMYIACNMAGIMWILYVLIAYWYFPVDRILILSHLLITSLSLFVIRHIHVDLLWLECNVVWCVIWWRHWVPLLHPYQ